MAQISGNSVIFQFGKESTYGTVAGATEQVRISSESLRPTYNKIEEGLATGGKGSGKVQTMGISAGGSFSTLMRPDMGYFLECLCGVANSGVYTAIGTALTDSLPSFTAYVDRKVKKFAYPGSKINQASFSASAGQYLSVTFDVVSKNEVENATMSTSLAPSSEKAFRFAGGSVRINGTAVADVTSIDFTWANNLASGTQTTATGDYYMEPECGTRQISGSLSMVYASGAENYRASLYKSDATFSLELKFESDENSLTIEIPAAQCTDAGANMGSPSDMLSQSFSWNAIEDGENEYCTITLE